MCINPRQTGFVGKGSEVLVLEPLVLVLSKFWLSHTPGKGVCDGAKFLAPPYYNQHAMFTFPLSAFFVNTADEHLVCHT